MSVQLKWLHQFQFAGYYAAIAKGFYRDAGFDVSLIEGNPSRSATEAVSAGEADFGISNSSLVISRAQGHDVVVVAPIFQHSPFVLLARRTPGLESVRDLAGRTIMIEADAAETIAYLRRAGVTEDRFTSVSHDGNLLALRDAGIDATTAYTTTEPYDLIQARVPFQVFSPREIGIDFYGDTLFTSGRLARERPELVRAFRDATIKGWKYALAHTDEIIDLIIRDYAPRFDRRKLEFEAEDTKRLMIADIVDLGYVSVSRWQHIAEVFSEVGLLGPNFSLDGMLFEADGHSDLGWLLAPLLLASLAVLVLSWTSHRFYRMNRVLKAEVAHRRDLEIRLVRLAATDALTGVPNRRHFFEVGRAEFDLARRSAQPLSVLLLDIDRFKAINDTFGHDAGDHVLRRVAVTLQEQVGNPSAVARLGGEEFAALLPGSDRQAAAACAERLRQALAGLDIVLPDQSPIAITASIGAVTASPTDRTFDAVVTRADKAMYEAKNAGRNRVTLGIAA